MLRMIQPPGNKQLGRLRGAENVWRQFAREIAQKQRRERDRILGRELIEEETRFKFGKPHRIRATYKGKLYKARLRRDGKVRWKGKLYGSPSGAAFAVLKRPANGWWFWLYERGPGDWVRISELRDREG